MITDPDGPDWRNASMREEHVPELEIGRFYIDVMGRVWWYADDDHHWGYFSPIELKRVHPEEDRDGSSSIAVPDLTPVEPLVAYSIVGRAILTIITDPDAGPMSVSTVYSSLNRLWPFS